MNTHPRALTFIKQLSSAYGAPGFEDQIVDVIEKNRYGFAFETDPIKNAYLNLDGQESPIMLDAHTDEIGFIVRYIEDNGLIAFLPLGGWSEGSLPSHSVMVRGKNGYHKGIITSKPIHFQSPEERGKAATIEHLRIDMGCSTKEELTEELGIAVGAPILPYSEFEYREDKGILMGKAFDNRLGCAAALEVMHRLKDIGFSGEVVAAFTTQEEVGGRGAAIAARKIKPRAAIVFEAAPADDTFTPKHQSQCAINAGPMIRHFDSTYIADEALIQISQQAAQKLDIPLQFAVRKGGGTNAGVIHRENEGIPCLVISIPTRYIHSHCQYTSMKDFQETVALAVEIVKEMTIEPIQ